MADETDTIVVSENGIPAQLYSAGRTIAIAVGMWAVGRGWLSAGTATALGTILLVAAPFVYGQLKVWFNHKKMVVLAASSPQGVVR